MNLFMQGKLIMCELTLSSLPKTWIFDFDGTLVVHNGYKNGEDKLLPGVKNFLDNIPSDDFVLIITGREEAAREKTIDFIKKQGLRCDSILFALPLGERILFNDKKPSGLKMSHSVNLNRNEGLSKIRIKIDSSI